MTYDKFGIPVFDFDDIVDLIYNQDASTCHKIQAKESEEIHKFNQAANEFEYPAISTHEPLNVDVETFDSVCQTEWLMPSTYLDIDVKEYVINLIKESNPNLYDLKVSRANAELEEYESRNMFGLLRYLIFLVDFMKEHEVIWGVGRGSSVASYVLYLLEVHCIDSVKYNLDWKEFLR